jgi:Fe-S cluster biogenesis protein NfuA
LKEEVEKIIERIRPNLQADGGDVELVDVDENGVVKVKLLGACHGCPMSIYTIKNGIEKTLKEHVKGVKEVKPV